MNILYLCSDLGIPVLGRHGASVHVRSLVAAFREAGHRVILAAPLLNKSPWEQQEELEAAVLHLPASAETSAAAFDLKMFLRAMGRENTLPREVRRILYNQEVERHLQDRFAENPPDFVYERASLFGTAGVQLARAWNCPLVVELNAPLAPEQAAYRGSCLAELAVQAERWVLSQADLVMVVSAQLSNYAIELGAEPDRVHVVPNGVNPALFRPRWCEGANDQPRTDQASPVLGFVGGLRPWHGVEVLPPLLDCLAARHSNLRLVIAGDGPLRGELERELDRRRLMSRVRFTGPVSQQVVAELICSFDVALAPYARPEHAFYFSPLKLFEYMACGVPVVAPRLGQIADLVRDGETGLLYPPGEFDQLTAACDRILSDRALGQRLGRAAAEEIHGRFTWDRNAARVIELVRSLPRLTPRNDAKSPAPSRQETNR